MGAKVTFTDFFIHRPVFAWVVNIILIMVGVVGLSQLTVRQYPRIENPVITVKTNWDADAPSIESRITKPIEEQLISLSELYYMTSDSGQGESKIRVYFQGRSVSDAYQEVHAKVSKIEELPESCARPVIYRGDVDAAPVMTVVVIGESSSVSMQTLYDTANNVLKGALESAKGVSTVDIFGGSDFQMNITLDPTKMAAHRVTAPEIIHAIKGQHVRRPAGKLRGEDYEISMAMRACLSKPHEFENIEVGEHNGQIIRLKDVGTARICPDEERARSFFNGKPAVELQVIPQSDANPIDISKVIKEKISELSGTKILPKGVKIEVASDQSIFIDLSIKQVYRALIEAVVLVLAVILFFLGSFRASLIPLITIPISIMASFFLIWVLGFTINLMSLLALVLAIGLVVDDAIVVLENIYRYIEEGMSPMKASIEGAREIRFSIIAMTLTLAAVYAPVAMGPGQVAKIFKEFALTLAGSVLISGVVALTLSPMMCSRLLVAHGAKKRSSLINDTFGWLGRGIQKSLNWVDRVYVKGVESSLKHVGAIISFSLVVFSLSMFFWVFHIKSEFMPEEDQGVMRGYFSAGLSRNLKYLAMLEPQVDKVLRERKEITNRLITIQSGTDSSMYATLVPWEERDKRCRDLLPDFWDDMYDLLGISYFHMMCPGRFAGGMGDRPVTFAITGPSADELTSISQLVTRALRKSEYLDPKTIDDQMEVVAPGYETDVDRDRAAQLGINPEIISETLSALLHGSSYGRIERENKTYPIRIHLEEKFCRSVDDILNLTIKGRKQGSREDTMLRIQDLVRIKYKDATPVIKHYMKRPSRSFSAGLAPMRGLGEAYEDVKRRVEEVLPSGAGYKFEPISSLKTFLKEGKNIYLIFGLALAFIFLVMAAQFESFRAPFIVLLTVPMALAGALFSLGIVKWGTWNVYSQIGGITLIGLITKHGILLVDFADKAREAGSSIRDAIVSACRLRLRPILMTTFAMVLGAVPLALAHGAGAEARRQIGIVIVGGMSIGTLFTLFVVPVMYVLLSRKKLKKA